MMQKNKIIIFQYCFLFILFLGSCQKDTGTSQVEGTVIDKTTGKPVPDAKVLILKQSNDVIGGMGSSTIASGNAGANGKFTLSFEAERNYNYEAMAIKDGYVNNGNNIAAISKTGGKNTVQVPLQPYAYLKLHIKNVNPFDNADYISANNSFDSMMGAGPFYGEIIDTIVVGRVQGNLNNGVIWFVRKNGINTSYNEKVFCPAHDTILFEIKY